MSELIDISQISTLHEAEVVKQVALGAEFTHEKNTIARIINTAANAGQTSVVYNHDISDAVLGELDGAGYKVIKPNNVANTVYIINWE